MQSSKATNAQRICSINGREISEIRRKLQATRNQMVSMFSADKAYRTRKDLPPEIYIPLVDSLYSDGRSLFIGSVVVSLAAALTAWKTSEPFLDFFVVAFMLVTLARAVDMRGYWRTRPRLTTVAPVRHWEHRYTFGAAVFAGLLGSWAFATFYVTEDPYSRLLSFVVTMAYMVGTPGRNFASNRLVTVQLVGEGVPLIAALIYVGGFYYVAFAAFLLPFFVALRFISDRLRRTLLDAVIASRDLALLAGRFDTALNNMPSGLCMFDADHRVAVVNNRLIELFDLPVMDRKGETARDLVRDSVAAGTILRSESDRFATDLEQRLGGADKTSFTIQKQDGRTLEPYLPADGERRLGGSGGRHYRTPRGRGTHPPSRPLRFPDRLAQSHASARAHGSDARRGRIEVRRRSSSSTSTSSSRSTTRSAIRAATCSCARSLSACGASCARHAMSLRASAATSSSCVQTPTAGPEEAATLARRIVAALSETYEVDGHQVVIGATIGIAMAPRDATGADHLLKNADMALYWAKAEQRGTWRFFEPGMDMRAQERRSLETRPAQCAR